MDINLLRMIAKTEAVAFFCGGGRIENAILSDTDPTWKKVTELWRAGYLASVDADQWGYRLVPSSEGQKLISSNKR